MVSRPILLPGAKVPTTRVSSLALLTGALLSFTTTSPDLRPAFSAGPPRTTCATSAPLLEDRFNDRARSGVRLWMLTPSQPRTILPVSSWGKSCFARLIGTANPIPWPRDMAVLMPITFPARSKSGPLELPGLIERITLDEVVVGTGPDRSLLGRHQTVGHREAEPERISDRDHPVAHLEPIAVAEIHIGEVGLGRLDLQQRDVDLRVGPDELGGEFAPVGHRHVNAVGPLDDVVVGEHVALLRDEEPRPQALALELALGHAAAEELAEELLEGLGALPRHRTSAQALAGVDVDDRRLDGLHERGERREGGLRRSPRVLVVELLGGARRQGEKRGGRQGEKNARGASQGTCRDHLSVSSRMGAFGPFDGHGDQCIHSRTNSQPPQFFRLSSFVCSTTRGAPRA